MLQINRHWEKEKEKEKAHVITAHVRDQQRRDEHGSAQCDEVMLEA
jgi:predicted nucleic acid-binding Zn ribbon protein